MTGITNTPFPAFVPEPTTCAASSAASESEAGVTSLRSMPRMSLDGVTGAAEP
jgi:hypothetical protein